MPPRPSPSRVAAALDYLQRLKSGVGEFVGGVGSNLADRARAAGGLAYEALTTDPNIGRMTTAEFSQAAADRAPTPRLDQAARDIGTIGRAIVTQPYETGKAIVGGEIDRFKGAFASPQALGDYAGSFIDPMRLAAALRHRIPISELDVYHGTPHKYAPTEANPLGEFDASKIGTGEGAQAYGHGIYYAENPNVAKSYMAAGGSTTSVPQSYAADIVGMMGGEREAIEHLKRIMPPKGEKTFSGESREFIEQTLRDVESGAYKAKQGSLYKADLPDEMIDRMLDWDKPLSEQSDAVKTLLRKQGITGRSYEVQAIGDGPEGYLNTRFVFDSPFEARAELNKLRQQGYSARPYRDGMGKSKTGAEFAQELTDPVQNAERLRSMGIPGIKYLDAGSRGQGGTGTRNFVVFPGEEKKVRILERK